MHVHVHIQLAMSLLIIVKEVIEKLEQRFKRKGTKLRKMSYSTLK